MSRENPGIRTLNGGRRFNDRGGTAPVIAGYEPGDRDGLPFETRSGPSAEAFA